MSRLKSNPDTGNRYLLTTTCNFEVLAGPCREFTLDAQLGGHGEQIYGAACRQRAGSWRIAQ